MLGILTAGLTPAVASGHSTDPAPLVSADHLGAVPLAPSLVAGTEHALTTRALQGAGGATTSASAHQDQPAPVEATVNATVGYEGKCTDDLGVTVVVDFVNLGGEPVVRCAPPQVPNQPFSGTGLNALEAAGIEVTGTASHGKAFICRLNNRPALDETLDNPSGGTYTERCHVAPPVWAFWSYWYSNGTSGTWTSSGQGAANRMAIPGGFEGWAFSYKMPPSTNPQPGIAPVHEGVVRIAGADRYATSAAIAGRTSPNPERVFLASGLDFPDALSASAIAGAGYEPVLLTRPHAVPGATMRALQALQPGEIVVVGSADTIHPAVITQLDDALSADIVRVAGADRYHTGRLLTQQYGNLHASRAHVANGENFPDALAASALAGRDNRPLLLTRPHGLPGPTRTALQATAVTTGTVWGDTRSVQNLVLQQLGQATGTAWNRDSGGDRYATAARVSRQYNPGVDVVYVASGLDFPDALSGAALAGSQGAPVLLTRPQSLPGNTASALARLQPERIIVLGDDSAISDSVIEQLEEYVD